MADVREYLLEDGRSPFALWFLGLEARAAAKVAVAKIKMSNGQFGNLKAVGEDVSEYRIDYGPGYRIHLGRDGSELLILLGGGDKTSRSGISPRRSGCGRTTSAGRPWRRRPRRRIVEHANEKEQADRWL